MLLQLKGKENVTKSGKKLHIYANIGSVGDVGYVLENDAGGIGLFRSEFLYIGRNELPTEEEQFQAYKQALQNMAGKKVIIRTLDIGADKQADYLNLGEEENPALGYRAIRICLTRPEIFKTQLRAFQSFCIRKSFYYVSHDYFCGRGQKDSVDCKRSQGGAGGFPNSIQRCGRGYYD